MAKVYDGPKTDIDRLEVFLQAVIPIAEKKCGVEVELDSGEQKPEDISISGIRLFYLSLKREGTGSLINY